jgi:hypothetical protein
MAPQAAGAYLPPGLAEEALVRPSRNVSNLRRQQEAAAAWAALTPAQRQKKIDDVRAAFKGIAEDLGPVPAWLRDDAPDPFKTASEFAERTARESQERAPKHIRFEHGEVKILASARNPRTEAAWDALMKTARDLGLI